MSIAIALVSAAAVVAVAWWASMQRTSPGPLHASHATIKAIKRGQNCEACHGEPPQTMAEACAGCHAPIADQTAHATGIHGALERAEVAECGACHREHVGGGIALVADLSFERAGIPDRDRYDHAHVGGFKLAGRHTGLACVKCHPHADDASLKEGDRRFLGLSWACTSCHRDVHEGKLGPDCASCHGQERAFKTVANFEHPKSFPLVEGHAGRACTSCHTPPNYKVGDTSCVACHRKDYDATTKPSHAAAGLGTNCAECHGRAKWTEGVRFEHPRAFALAGGHGGVACASCHEAGAKQGRVEAFKRTRGCAECHPSPHAETLIAGVARLGRGTAPARACEACHSAADRTFAAGVERMTAMLHAATGFALGRPHDRVECAKCHAGYGTERPGTEAERRSWWVAAYPGRSAEDCAACHKDPHLGQFAGSRTGGRCVECHERVRFVPPTFDAASHARSSFPLTGSHTAVACVFCHKVEDGVRRFVPTPGECAGCHADVHEGRFDGPTMRATLDGRSGCARCHTTGSFRVLSWTGEDHGTWTGFALRGAHAKAACARCHERGGGGTPQGGVPRSGVFARAPKACAACHQDPHAGQFVVRGATDCARCHGEESFKATTFDHQRDSAFKLDEQHARLACAACHRAYQEGGASIVRYKPLGKTCAECHDPRRGDGRGAK